MILEVAMLQVKSDLENDFEKDFAKAGQYISSIAGYRGHSLKKCLEVENKYILLVNWETLAAHTIGFRQSEVYLKWKELLHRYYEPFPTVEHYKPLFENKSTL
jgi:heme-degrading monooxygenase HmoA